MAVRLRGGIGHDGEGRGAGSDMAVGAGGAGPDTVGPVVCCGAERRTVA